MWNSSKIITQPLQAVKIVWYKIMSEIFLKARKIKNELKS